VYKSSKKDKAGVYFTSLVIVLAIFNN